MSKLKELQELSYLTSRGTHFRCSICNTVSNEGIETDLGDYRPHTSFTSDPKDRRHFICVTCDEIINDTLSEFEEE